MTKEELTKLNELVAKLQSGRDVYNHEIDKESQIEFPRKYLRPLENNRSLFPYIKNRELSTKIASHVMHRDTLHWLWLKTDIFGHARQMIVKFQLINFGAILEAVVKYLKPEMAKKDVYAIINSLSEEGLISNPKELKELWKARKSIHLHLTGDVENVEFSDENYKLWHSALGTMINDLRKS
jgi:hypothetical protein